MFHRHSKNKETLISFILDESGSMDIIRDSTIKGFNDYVAALKGQIKMTLTKFSNGAAPVIYNGKPISEVPRLSVENYRPNGDTPLYDAIGRTIAALEADSEGKQVMLTIMTDGEENASREFNRDKINKLIRDKQEKGWVFNFLGANQDSWQVGQAMGIPQAYSINFAGTAVSSALAFKAMASNANNFVNMGTAQSAMFNSKTVEDYEEVLQKAQGTSSDGS